MEKHPDAIDGTSCVPWEPLGQIDPGELPEPSEKYPGPWSENHRGNGHVDVVDGQGRVFAHVFCWDGAEWRVLYQKSRLSVQWAFDNKVSISKDVAVRELKRRLDDRAQKLDDEKRPLEAWVDVLD